MTRYELIMALENARIIYDDESDEGVSIRIYGDAAEPKLLALHTIMEQLKKDGQSNLIIETDKGPSIQLAR